MIKKGRKGKRREIKSAKKVISLTRDLRGIIYQGEKGEMFIYKHL